jgi:hypothetical protein
MPGGAVHLDVPDIDVIWTDEPDPHAPVGARGVGEIGITGVGAAIANAVFNATGKARARPANHARQGDVGKRLVALRRMSGAGGARRRLVNQDWVACP